MVFRYLSLSAVHTHAPIESCKRQVKRRVSFRCANQAEFSPPLALTARPERFLDKTRSHEEGRKAVQQGQKLPCIKNQVRTPEQSGSSRESLNMRRAEQLQITPTRASAPGSGRVRFIWKQHGQSQQIHDL